MGTKLLWIGLTLIEADRLLTFVPAVNIVGALVMILGCVLLVLDK